MTQQEFDARKEQRIERMKDHAQNAATRSNTLHDAAHSMASVIPFGQPILVGHHSEGRDRKYRKRIHDKFERSFEEQKKADYWQRRIEATESNHAISSDDPSAIEKLEARIADCQATQDVWKAINKIVNSRKKSYSDEQRRNDLLTLEAHGAPVNLTVHDIAELFSPRFGIERGIAKYRLQNNNANINRMRKRVETLKALREEVDVSASFETSEGTVTIRYNVDENRVQLLFPEKPGESVRRMLGQHGFRWCWTNTAWQRHLNDSGKYEAKRIVRAIMLTPDKLCMDTYCLPVQNAE